MVDDLVWVLEVLPQAVNDHVQELAHVLLSTDVKLGIVSISLWIERHCPRVKRRAANTSRNWWANESARLARKRLSVGRAII
jgi:flagellar biosynthesis regulator FlaF